MKATHNGTCQVCGRSHAFNGSTIAKHGYTVHYGFFNGVCPGAENKPLQHDRTIADGIIHKLHKDADWLRARADRLESGEEQVDAVSIHVWEGNRQVSRRMTRDETSGPCELSAWDRAAEHLPVRLRRQADLQDRAADEIAARADRLHGTDLLPRQTKVEAEKIRFIKYSEARRIKAEYDAKGHKTMIRSGRYYGDPITLYVYPL